jgi:uncharacterized protein YbbC (DUF1343 family)
MQVHRFLPGLAALALGLLLAGGCGTKTTPPAAGPRTVTAPTNLVFRPDRLTGMDSAIRQAIADRKCPGGVLWLERRGTAYYQAYGQRAVVPTPEPMTEDTIFDAASLTKVLATAPAIMSLVERGQIQLDATAQNYLAEFTGDGKEAITIRQLLTHTSGLPPGIGRSPDWTGYDTAIRLTCAVTLINRPGTTFVYSDINFIVLGEIVRRVSGRGLDVFTTESFYRPLGMVDTEFNPPSAKFPRIAPTEVVDGKPFRGVVHDPTSRRMGGVAGHAGLFTTAADLARFCRMMLNGGELDGVRVLRPETVALMTSVQTPPVVPARRGLGWDIDSPYAGERGDRFPLGGYGHTGWTGGSLWIDPFSRTFVIFLSNRNHPDESGNVLPLRHVLGTLAAEAVVGFDFSAVPGALPARTNTTPARPVPVATSATVLNGIDVLAREQFAPLRGLRVGLITNPTGHDRERRATIDLLKAAPEVRLVALFSPEHGLRGERDERIGDSVDERTGLPVYSLYGERRQPTAAQLQGLDALVFDIQDIGCRFYTYIATMGLCMEEAAKAGVKFVVLDRVNPIGGVAVDGPVYAGQPTFTAFHALPLRHGMTVGELARMFNAERGWHCDLTVIPVAGWSRTLWFDQTGLPWTNPSPNMRSLAAATLYPGVGLLETALSVGRGTETPFELVGAPYIDEAAWAVELNRVGVTGVRFEPARFTPTASVFKDRSCGGVRIRLTDRDQADAVGIGIVLAQTLHRLYPRQFNLEKMNALLQDPATLDGIRSGKSLAEIRALWNAPLVAFRERRAKFLLYP